MLAFIFTLFFRDSLPENFIVNNEKIVYQEQTVSPKQCNDVLLLQISHSQIEDSRDYFILAQCQNNWKWFAQKQQVSVFEEQELSLLEDGSVQILNQDFIENFSQKVRLFAIGKNSLALEDVAHKHLFLYNHRHWQKMDLYKATPKLLFFSLQNNWYIMHSQETNGLYPAVMKYQIIPSHYLHDIPEQSYWSLIERVFFVEAEQLFGIRFHKKWSKELAIYDFAADEWLVAPSALLPLSVWRQMKNGGFNVFLRMHNTHDTQQKVYYEIRIDGELIDKSDTTLNEKAMEFIYNLSEGSHVLEVTRYVSDWNNERYIKDNNIYQLDPITISTNDQRINLIYLRSGSPEEDKAFYLDNIVLPRN